MNRNQFLFVYDVTQKGVAFYDFYGAQGFGVHMKR